MVRTMEYVSIIVMRILIVQVFQVQFVIRDIVDINNQIYLVNFIMMKYSFLILVIMFFSSCQEKKAVPAKLSKGIIQFDKTSHDFGTIKEDSGSVIYKFTFKNVGTEPVIISNVKSSCGCTSPRWSKEVVEPGDSGFVEAKYNPLGHPGIFNKVLSVVSNTTDSLSGLFIVGNVIERKKPSIQIYGDSIGSIKFATRQLNFGKITNEEPIEKEFKIYNSANHNVKFNNPEKLPNYLKISFIPKIIPPNKFGIIKLIFDPRIKGDYGIIDEMISISTNDEKTPVKNFYFSANISQYFPPLTDDELANSPKISFNKIMNDFGKVKKGDAVSTKFIVKNEGAKDLIIYKMEPSCYCTKADIDKSIIKPGETSKINVTYDSRDRSQGPDTKTVSIYCNDPSNSVPSLIINTTVTL